MHSGNILVSPLREPSIYNYKIGSKIYSLLSYVNCTIIDYGSAHVSGLTKYARDQREEEVFGFTRTEFHSNRDLYTLIMTVFVTFLSSRTDIKQIFNKNNVLNYLIKELFSAYSELFIKNPLAYIENYLMNSDFLKPQTSPAKKNKIIKEVLNSIIINKRQIYWLYLPPRYQSPKTGIYRSMETFTNYLNSTIPKPGNYKVYNWGDWSPEQGIGCVSNKYTQNKSQQIQNLQNVLNRMDIE
jgi:hypothetical protein